MAEWDDIDARGVDGSRVAAADAGILWGVGAVSRRLGIATATLRTWDRRYGLGPSERTEGGHRRYSELDVARVAQMSQLIAEGVPSAQAARVAQLAQAGAEPAGETSTSLARQTARAGDVAVGARGVPMTVNAMLRATQELNAPTLAKIVSQVFDRRGVLDGWSTVVAPYLMTVGQQWEIGQLGIAAEHMASECISTELRQRMRSRSGRRPANPPVVLASAAEEQHALPLVVLAAALSERRIGTRMLGARTPTAALTAAVDRLCPRVVFLWSSLAATGTVPSLATVDSLDPELVVLLGGPGWHPTGDPAESVAVVERVASLEGAVGRIADLVA
ncbi:MAG: MerR family transcriptional regulator [Nocardioidaceae bacterium]|nr:MerR family transcriptional regulator [Nocardioidaceae bacterium]